MTSFFEAVKVHKKVKAEEPIWLIAYVDLTTNLMALFIMMLAFSRVDTNKFDAVSKAVTRQRTDSLDQLQQKLNQEIATRKLGALVSTELGMFGLNVEFKNGVMYESGNANVSEFAKTEAMPLLKILGGVDAKYLLSFEGHTDDMPVSKKGAFKDNWALSSARGVSLLDILKQLGVPETRMNVAGFASTRPKVSPEGKLGKELDTIRAANRRIVIRVYQ